MLLADTSVWIDHLRSGNPRLAGALERDDIATHPFIVGELACGQLRNRNETLDLISRLPVAATATDDEALAFIERHRLMGLGIGYVDVHLLASAALGSAAGEVRLWTIDARLHGVARRLGLAATTH